MESEIKCPTFEGLVNSKKIAQSSEIFAQLQAIQVCVNNAINIIRVAMAEDRTEVKIPVDAERLPYSVHSSARGVLEANGFKLRPSSVSETQEHGAHWIIDLTY